MKKMLPVIDIHELLNIYKQPNVLIFDVSNSNDAKDNYDKKHLDGAVSVDLNTQLAAIKSDVSDGGRHPLPTVEHFAETLQNLGISSDSHIVIYDDKNGANAAARFWWMLKSAGHQKVQVLNGGFQQAEKAGFPVNDKIPTANVVEKYKMESWKLPLAVISDVAKNSQNDDFTVIDVREAARYQGDYELIDLVAGHIPGAINIPFTTNLDENGLFLPADILKEKYAPFFKSKLPENIIVHCGSGVTACHTLLAIDYAGLPIPKLYVGSWSEWSRNFDNL